MEHGGVVCSANLSIYVSAVLAYPSTSGVGCLLTQCDMTTLLLGGCDLITLPISEDTLLPSHTVGNVVPATYTKESTESCSHCVAC